jgi:hypothetical protein
LRPGHGVLLEVWKARPCLQRERLGFGSE